MAAGQDRTAERPCREYRPVTAPRKRLSPRLVNDLPAAKCPASVAGAKIGKDGFTRDRCLTNGHQRRRSLRQIDVQARAKTDHTKTLPGSDGLAGPYEADNPPRDKACNLYNRNSRTRRGDHQAIALVVDTRLVEIGVEEFAGVINDFLDLPGDRTAVNMAVEHAHEDRNARQWSVAEIKVGRRNRAGDLAYATICRRHHQAVPYRGHPRGIAEEIRAPDRCQRPEPSERAPEPKQDEARQCEGPDEGIPLRSYRNELRADRIIDRHAAILLRCVGARFKRHRIGGTDGVVHRRGVAIRRGLFVLASQSQLLAGLFGLTLPVPHAGVETIPRKQRIVRTTFDYFALIQHDDFIRSHNGGKPMRYHQRGAIARYALQRILNFLFCVAIERGGCLIERQNGWSLENGTCNRHALLLTA